MSADGLIINLALDNMFALRFLTLYYAPDRRERLGRSGRAYVEARYTPQVVARQYASLLERTAEA